MTPAKKTVDQPRDLTALPVEGDCDPMDVFSHHWVEVVPWHAEYGAVGEFRELRCDRAGCGLLMGEVREVDPANPLPVPDPTVPPVPKSAEPAE